MNPPRQNVHATSAFGRIKFFFLEFPSSQSGSCRGRMDTLFSLGSFFTDIEGPAAYGDGAILIPDPVDDATSMSSSSTRLLRNGSPTGP